MSQELATTYASLILADENLPIEAENILKLTSAAGVEVEGIWATLLAKALEGKDVAEILTNISSGAAAAPAAAGAPAAAADAPAEEAPKKEEAKEESDDDMGLGLFD
ncbi:hypothetical protein E3Q22_03991 [Wallemia mellicola]|uniref:Ribosomal protein 60S n=4 Tax=Opisthokonta TaxID=33154 RepID=A0A4T0M8U7_9BASI|nr:ribosomal protein 60S [Wallemia mellicola CBS 633.66]TIB67601.1 hypothetical protein E3Q24_04137 [Wallemia mellicola]EIM22818.1 ribosomal protein 60S [Wallemia mellicola CBS 633.66]TIB70412.1 hypothetical protein E3Q23_04178 [Wallemia mellicola]TIB75453.1 hypothetical protein E3Q22_03991 [Wallemia mellicola]TIB79339.1 hypothetical protein E3Q21_04176 [Wallemia mellicola]|eukprot:XP_006956871.1 ribosomal protein 60S [Wallemia mellicola CBS 633.66]